MPAFNVERLLRPVSTTEPPLPKSSKEATQDDFEQPRRAPPPPPVPSRLSTGVSEPPSLDDVPEKSKAKKTSWLSKAFATDSSDVSLLEEAPGIISRGMLPTSPSREAKRSKGSRHPVTAETDKDAHTTPSSPDKTQEKTLTARPSSLKLLTYRPSSITLTARGLYSLVRGNISPSKEEKTPTSPITNVPPESISLNFSLLPPTPPPNRSLPALPSSASVKRKGRRKRSRSCVTRLATYTKDPLHRHVYAHGAFPVKDRSPTSLMAGIMSTDARIDVDVEELLSSLADLLSRMQVSSHYRLTSRPLDSGLIDEVSRMTWKQKSAAQPRWIAP